MFFVFIGQYPSYKKGILSSYDSAGKYTQHSVVHNSLKIKFTSLYFQISSFHSHLWLHHPNTQNHLLYPQVKQTVGGRKK